jgi:hypothetical protein
LASHQPAWGNVQQRLTVDVLVNFAEQQVKLVFEMEAILSLFTA